MTKLLFLNDQLIFLRATTNPTNYYYYSPGSFNTFIVIDFSRIAIKLQFIGI